MGCADCELVTAAVASILTLVGTHTVLEPQTGGAPGRSILLNIIACDGGGLLAHLEGRNDSAQLFTDLDVAFPRPIIEWAMHVLQRVGAPAWSV
eukprot:1026104-Pyramimonas_sp.AAC.2